MCWRLKSPKLGFLGGGKVCSPWVWVVEGACWTQELPLVRDWGVVNELVERNGFWRAGTPGKVLLETGNTEKPHSQGRNIRTAEKGVKLLFW